MHPMLSQLIAALAYPGLLTTLVLTVAVVMIAQLDAPGGGLSRGLLATLQGKGSLLLLISAALALIAGAFLPWPLNPIHWDLGHFWLAIGLLEASALMALLPGLREASPAGVRAAIREAQVGGAGRIVLWSALAIVVWAGREWTWRTLATHLFALGAAGVALPSVLGWGYASPAYDISPGGVETGLNQASASMGRWARAIRSTVFLSTIPLIMLPPSTMLPPVALIAVCVGIVLLLAGWGRVFNSTNVRRPILDVLRIGGRWAIPLLVLAAFAHWLAVRI